MDKTDLKEHYRRDIGFHLRCAMESVEKLEAELDIKNVDDVEELTLLMETKGAIDTLI